MPAGRVWVVEDREERSWEVKTARESEVYHRPLDKKGKARGGWRPGLPPLRDESSLPWSLREVLEVFRTARHGKEESC